MNAGTPHPAEGRPRDSWLVESDYAGEADHPAPGRAEIVLMPEGEAATGPAPGRDRIDPTLVKALACAHWSKLLEEGHYASVGELARAA